MRLRHAVRAVILDEHDRILLARHQNPRRRTPAVWAAPGGRIEPGETHLQALRRELREEVGLELTTAPPHVWHRDVPAPDYLPGYDRAISDYYLVRTPVFTPRGSFTDTELAAEHIQDIRWWSLPDIKAHPGPDQFGPYDLATALTSLIAHGPPPRPITVS